MIIDLPIAPSWNWNINTAAAAFSGTATPNRTKLELKHIVFAAVGALIYPPNRTKLELKPICMWLGIDARRSSQSHQAGIETDQAPALYLSDNNSQSHQAGIETWLKKVLTKINVPPNRTKLELKLLGSFPVQ